MSSLHCFVLFFGILVPTFSATEWSFYTYLGESFDLTCDDYETNITTSESGQWTLPSGKILVAGDIGYEIITENNIRGYTLKINKITEEMSGVYICKILDANRNVRTQVLRGLNISGPKYRVWTDKYTKNFVRAVIAASCFLVPMLTFCFVQKFRYRTEKEALENNGSPFPAYTNKAFDDNIVKQESIDTKM